MTVSDEISISPASVHDVDDIARLYLKALSEELSSSSLNDVRSADTDAISNVRSFVSDAIDNGSFCIITAKTNTIVGYIMAYEKHQLAEKPRVVGCINGIYVSEEYRGCKVADKLLDEALKWFSSKNISTVELTVTIGNKRAESFWNRRGFTTLEQIFVKRI